MYKVQVQNLLSIFILKLDSYCTLSGLSLSICFPVGLEPAFILVSTSKLHFESRHLQSSTFCFVIYKNEIYNTVVIGHFLNWCIWYWRESMQTHTQNTQTTQKGLGPWNGTTPLLFWDNRDFCPPALFWYSIIECFSYGSKHNERRSIIRSRILKCVCFFNLLM